MTRATLLLLGRARAEASMIDTCTIRRTTGVTTNDHTGVETPTQTTVYDGRCRVQQSPAMGGRVESGEASLVVVHLFLHLPVVDSANVLRGDIVTVTSCVNDPALVGRTFRIRDLHHKSEATARRMQCEEVT